VPEWDGTPRICRDTTRNILNRAGEGGLLGPGNWRDILSGSALLVKKKVVGLSEESVTGHCSQPVVNV